MVVFRNALSGMNAEHSPAEATMHEAVWGVPLFQRMRDLGPWAYPDTYREPAEPLAPVRELLFKPTPGLPQALEAAAQRYRADSEDLDCRALLFDEWGGEWAKSQGLPIDSVVQMALQLAWGTLHGQPGVATYETAHLRLFKGARTETCRSCSVESVAWVRAHLAGAPLAEQKRLFKAATESQKNYMVDAIQAKGCDRHLMGLRLLAMANGMQPGIFTVSGWRVGLCMCALICFAFHRTPCTRARHTGSCLRRRCARRRLAAFLPLSAMATVCAIWCGRAATPLWRRWRRASRAARRPHPHFATPFATPCAPFAPCGRPSPTCE